MRLYLIRHAIAFDRDPALWPDDRDRPLTPEGKKKFRRAALGLLDLAPAVDVLLSSGLTRAWQTAQILARQAGWPVPLPCPALERAHAAAEVVAALQPYAAAESVALVGHEPALHELASYLLTGDGSRVLLEIKKGGALCFQLAGGAQVGAATVSWLVTPRVLRALSSCD